MTDEVEVAIIGAGPAGLSAAASAASRELNHILIERREIGNTVFNYQLRKLVMAEPGKLPLRSQVPFEAGSREQVLEAWNQAVKEKKVSVLKADVGEIKKEGNAFSIKHSSGTLRARNVILAIGVQGTPRKLGVPGEDSAHVAYTLADPDEFKDRDILVVGVGDAGIENALALCDKNRVSILNRTADFSRAKEANIKKITDAIRAGKIRLFTDASVARVEPTVTYINTPEGEVCLPCNHIIARLGGILPRKFLESSGITFPNSNPDSVPLVSSRYESNVPGLFILGALIGYPLIKQAMNQGYEVIEHILGNPIEPADQVLVDERLKGIPGDSKAVLTMIRQSLPLFAELSDAQFRELIIDSTVHSKKRGEIVFERNDYTDTFWSVVSGSTAVALPNGEKAIIPQGNFFGEIGLMSGRRRLATVSVAEDSILLESPRKQILKLNSSVDSVKRAIDEAFMLRALQTSIFPEAEFELLKQLVHKVVPKNFKKGDILFREGESGEFGYVIRKGSVKISRRNRDGADVTQTYIPAGNLVGEMALLSQELSLRSATVTAAVACETLAISKADFLQVLAETPKAKERLGHLAAERQIQNIAHDQNEYRGQVLDFMIAQGVTDADNFLLIDSDLCVGCDNCEKACAATHNGYTRLDRKGGKTFACIQIPISCRHCENPLCMLDCPPDALTRQANGEVVIRDSCIGCGNCVRNCPYGVIQMVYDQPPSGWSLWSLLGVTPKKAKEKGPAKAAKCDMCQHLDGGPACVRSCPTGAAMRVNPSKMLKILGEKREHVG